MIYFESLYLITSTISTVGYGDLKGFVNADASANWEAEMIFLSIVIVVGMLIFSSVTNEIFSY